MTTATRPKATKQSKKSKGLRQPEKGSVCQISDGRWLGTYSTGVKGENGAYIKKSFYSPTRDGAIDQLNEYHASFDKQALIAEEERKKHPHTASKIDENSALDDAISSYLYDVTKHRLAPKTFETRCYGASLVSRFIGSKTLKDVAPSDIIQLITGLQAEGKSFQTIDKPIQVLKLTLDYMMDELAPFRRSNPVKNRDVKQLLKLIRSEQESKAKSIPPELIKLMFQELTNSRLRYYFPLVLTTGLRPGEAMAIQWGDIDFEKLELRVERDISRTAVYDEVTRKRIGTKLSVGKLKSPSAYRTIPLHPEHIRLFELQKQILRYERVRYAAKYTNNDWVFPSEIGTIIEPRNVNRDLDVIRERCEELRPYSPHCLRHTYMTLCQRAGMNELVLKKISGHSSGASSNVTALYTAVRQDEVAEEYRRTVFDRIGEILAMMK